MHGNLLNYISQEKPGGKNIKFTKNYISTKDKYESLILVINNEQFSYYNKEINEIEILLFDIIRNESKDLDIICSLAIIWIINYGMSGFKSGLMLIKDLIKDFWEYLIPDINEEMDSIFIRSNILRKFDSYASLNINQFLFIDKNKKLSLIQLIKNKDNEHVINYLIESKESIIIIIEELKEAILIISEIEEFLEKKIKEEEEKFGEDFSDAFVSFSKIDESIGQTINTILSIFDAMQESLEKKDAYEIPDSQDFNVDEEKNDKKIKKNSLEDIINEISYLNKELIKDGDKKLLGLAIKYCIDNINVESFKLIANTRNSQILNSLIEELINKLDD